MSKKRLDGYDLISTLNLLAQLEKFGLVKPPKVINDILQDHLKGKYLLEFAKISIALAPIVPIQSLPPKIWRLKIENFEITDFSWNKPNLGLGMILTLSGDTLKNKNLRGRLSATVDILFKSGGNGENWGSTLRVKGPELPNFEEGKVWSLEMPLEARQLFKIENSIVGTRKRDVTVAIKVPEKANLRSLPRTPLRPNKRTYKWVDDNAVDVLTSLATGEASILVDYTGMRGEKEGPSEKLPVPLIGALAAIAALLASVVWKKIL